MRSSCGLVAAALAFSACASLRVQMDYDRSADFSQLESFAFTPDAGEPLESGLEVPGDEEELIEAARGAIASELEARGYTRAEDPSFFVDFHLGTEQKVKYVGVSTYTAYGPSVHTTVVPHPFEQGMLVIDVLRASDGAVIWHGWAYEAIDGKQDLERRVRRAVAKVLKLFPPQ